MRARHRRRTGPLTSRSSWALAAGGGWGLGRDDQIKRCDHACAAKHAGGLRLARTCNKHERAITLNVQLLPESMGRTGPLGRPGAPGTARGYGLVASDGMLTRSKNSAVTHPATGIYYPRRDRAQNDRRHRNRKLSFFFVTA